ncbi:hypothetical protein [uncultured Gilvimarinus sp.]|uniref:hypothetical protein n=1 Tax=uncultured Gilvimarinus sp. TaxID=1689143 RepID=UPI0030D7113E
MVLRQNDLKPQPLHETLSNVLILCNQWRSLDGHVAVAIEKMPDLQNHAQQLRQGLEHMVERGLLVDAVKLSQNFAEPASPNPEPEPEPEGIKTLYVRTYRCPQALERLLQSLQAGRTGASVHTLVVVDDAREESDLELSRTLLASWRQRLSPDLIHITRADREHLADAMAAASGADAQDLRWWLNGDPDDPEMTAGATFNTALLLSAGTNTAMLDDDAQLTPYGDPQEASEMGSVNIGGVHKEEAHWRMYPSTEAMESAWSPLGIDPLADHSRWLGQSLSTLVAQAASPEAFWQPISSVGLHNLKPHAKVKVSVNGILGDPGTGQASWLYTQPPEQLAPWLQNEEAYQQLVSKRLLTRKPQGFQLLSHHSLLTPLVGVDNRQLMPPTIPNGRGEDSLFVELACCVYPDCLFAQLPWMLKHVPEREREFDRDSLLRPVTTDSNLLLNHYLHKLRHAVPDAGPDTRLQWLGKSLQALAQAPEATLATDYQLHLSADRSNMAQQLTRNLQALQPPAYLADDMQLLLTRCLQGIDADQKKKDSIILKTRQRAGRYSQALASWHTAWEYCQQLGEPQVLAMAKERPPASNPRSDDKAASGLTRQLQKWGLLKRS